MSDLRYRLRTAAVEAEAFYHSDVADLFNEANARVGALEAEVERLRAHLVRIVERYDDSDAGTYDRALDNAIEAARAALVGEGDENPPRDG